MQCVHIEDPYEHMDKYYQYGYQVDDHYTGECPRASVSSCAATFTFAAGDYHGHMEHTAGQLTKGEYKVKLPDGRVQVVSYEADHAGFRPRVTYEGVAAVAPGNDNSVTICHRHLFSESAPVLRTHDHLGNQPSSLPTPQHLSSHKHLQHENNNYKHTIIKIPYQKPEEAFVLKHQEILPTPIPKHTYQLKAHDTAHHFNEYQATNLKHHNPQPVEHLFHEERPAQPVMVTVSPAPATHYEVRHYSPGLGSQVPALQHHAFPDARHLMSSAPVTISPSLFVPHLTAERRYSTEDTQPRPSRARPRSYNEMRLVTPTPGPLTYSTFSPSSSKPATPAPKPLNIQTYSAQLSNMNKIKQVKEYVSNKFDKHLRPALPPISNNPEPLLVHRAEPMMSFQQQLENSYQSPEDFVEEPKFLVQLVPNPKYKPTPEVRRRAMGSQRENKIIPVKNQSKDPNLYPYLYVLSSYLPQTQHSLVVAKKY